MFVIMYILPYLVTDESSVFHLKTALNESYMELTAVYICFVAFFTYCQFEVCLLFYTPLYLVSSYLTSTHE